jgi:ABC-type sugar transport system ATPase subunit
MFEAVGVSKHYGGVAALRDTDLRVLPGRVHALLGENGAGKSTLVKILTGSVRPDSGRLTLDGKGVRFAHAADAARQGIAVVSQELNLFPDLSVLANLFTMREPRGRTGLLDRTTMTREALPVLAELGVDVDLRRNLGALSLADRQLIEIARALLTRPRVLVLDEPTSALESASSDNLLRIIAALRSRGTAVVFVSHILEEVLAVSDEVTVLRDGQVVLAAADRRELDIPTIVEAMLGGKQIAIPAATSRLPRTSGNGRGLQVRDVPLGEGAPPVSLTVRPGEILGLAGLVGAGHQRLMRMIAGSLRPRAGQIVLPSGSSVPRTHRAAVAAGVALVSGDRRRLGLMLDKPLWENIGQVRSVALRRDGTFVSKQALRSRAAAQLATLGVKARSADSPAGSLSGGNQQKIVFAQWLEITPQVLLLDDPTRGVDVGAKAEMHQLIRALSGSGAVVLLCSTDIQELAELCDRVIVFYQHSLAGELSDSALTQHALLEAVNTGLIPAA